MPDAQVRVLPEAGAPIVFQATDLQGICSLPGEVGGTCYVAVDLPPDAVAPGERYTLDVGLPDGGRLTGSTTVPGTFRMIRPVDTEAGGRCTIPPGTLLELQWTRSLGAWVYVVEADFGATLREAFPQYDVPAPFRTVGLSVGSADTTLVFPAEVGLFERFEEDATEVLAALQQGMPSGTEASVAVAAADRNYVNWVRGGSFNPSGNVRLASVTGDGTGVFGSLVVRDFRLFGRAPGSGGSLPPCMP